MSLLVICPSRGRPDKAKEAYHQFEVTKHGPDTKMVFVVDDDDETKDGYEGLPTWTSAEKGGSGMGHALNVAAVEFVGSYDVLGFIGDDHRFRTPGWDEHFERTLNDAGGGIAYGNDLYQGINLPTQVFMSSKIVATLGWMCLPGAKHLYLDNTWKVLGEGLGRLFYLPEIVIEHVHPIAGKADWDENYQRVNDQAVYAHDRAIFDAWRANTYSNDVARVAAVLGR